MDDQNIIEMYFDRNENAIKETDIKYGKLCMGIAYNILNDHFDSEECVNDTYLSVWNQIPPTRPTNFRAFLCKITRNISLKRYNFNHAAKRNRMTEVSFSELESILSDQDCQSVLENEYLANLISDFLRSEKEDARNVFLRKYWFFDTVEEIAERYSFTESKVKSMLSRTRNRMKDFLLQKGARL